MLIKRIVIIALFLSISHLSCILHAAERDWNAADVTQNAQGNVISIALKQWWIEANTAIEFIRASLMNIPQDQENFNAIRDGVENSINIINKNIESGEMPTGYLDVKYSLKNKQGDKGYYPVKHLIQQAKVIYGID